MRDKRWKFPPAPSDEVQQLGKDVGCSHIVAQLLWQRGQRDVRSAQRYLAPLEEQLPVDYALTDLQKAADRVRRARERNEHVRVYGDYDVDGVSATALTIRGLRQFGLERLDSRIPERETEGYGLGPDQVRAAANDGVQVLVTVDNGIAAHEAAQVARELGLDLIITDHHRIEGGIPDAAACVNPKRDGEEHPLYDVCGSTVAWLLLHELLGGAAAELGYVALGTVADVMPLIGVNRVLVAHGLRALSQESVLGIVALADNSKVALSELKAEHIAFHLGPRINAVGRLGNARAALDLLLTEDRREAARLSRELDAANVKRRDIERTVFKEAVGQLESDWDPARKTIVLGNENWPRGVIGIVAARVAERFERPTALLSLDADGFAYASARSRPGFDLMEAVSACSGRLVKYGGHRGAAGFTLHRSALEDFIDDFENAAGRMAWEASPEEVEIDAVMSFSEIGYPLLADISRMEPFGAGNSEPVFCTSGVEIPRDSLRVFNGGHLGLQMIHDGRGFPGIAFHMGAWSESLKAHPGVFDILYRPKFNRFRDQVTIQLQVQDIRPA